MSKPASPEIITLRIPFVLRKRGGRKEVVLPEGVPLPRPRIDSALVKALARAFRWKRMLESGDFATIGDLAAYERIAPSYMTRVMRMTLLPPDLVEAILEGRQGPEVTMAGLMEPIEEVWGSEKDVLQT